MNSSYGRFRHPRARARPPRSCQQLYAEGKRAEILAPVEACLPKDAAGNFIASQERSDVVHDSPGLRSGQTGARTGAAGRVRGLDGQTAALAGADQENGRADRRGPGCTG